MKDEEFVVQCADAVRMNPSFFILHSLPLIILKTCIYFGINS